MRHGLRILHETCPRCANRRTVLIGTRTAFCFNCRSQLGPFVPEYPFTARELVRLRWYRAAVRAGFYTDATAGAAQIRPRLPLDR
jgi:hypothetical protein